MLTDFHLCLYTTDHWPKAEVITDDRSIYMVKGVITHCAPDSTVVDFQASFTAVGAAHQSNTCTVVGFINNTASRLHHLCYCCCYCHHYHYWQAAFEVNTATDILSFLVMKVKCSQTTGCIKLVFWKRDTLAKVYFILESGWVQHKK